MNREELAEQEFLRNVYDQPAAKNPRKRLPDKSKRPESRGVRNANKKRSPKT
jgi:hypothetical protein